MSIDPRLLVFVGTHGHVRAIDKRTGQDVWSTSLPGTGYELVSLLYESGVLLAGSKGYLFALNPVNGTILWTNELKGLDYEHMILASAGAMTDPLLLHVQHAADEAEKEERKELKEKLKEVVEKLSG